MRRFFPLLLTVACGTPETDHSPPDRDRIEVLETRVRALERAVVALERSETSTNTTAGASPALDATVGLGVQVIDALPPLKLPSRLVVHIEPDGLRLGEDPVDSEALLARLLAVHRAHPSASVMLIADETVGFERVIAVQDLVRKSGIERFGIVSTADEHGAVVDTDAE